jgi:hypothetical protein
VYRIRPGGHTTLRSWAGIRAFTRRDWTVMRPQWTVTRGDWTVTHVDLETVTRRQGDFFVPGARSAAAVNARSPKIVTWLCGHAPTKVRRCTPCPHNRQVRCWLVGSQFW